MWSRRSFAKVHTALFTAPHRSGVSAHGAYGDNVEEMDWAVGEILAQLDASGVRNDTIVFFTSGAFISGGTRGYNPPGW